MTSTTPTSSRVGLRVRRIANVCLLLGRRTAEHAREKKEENMADLGLTFAVKTVSKKRPHKNDGREKANDPMPQKRTMYE